MHSIGKIEHMNDEDLFKLFSKLGNAVYFMRIDGTSCFVEFKSIEDAKNIVKSYKDQTLLSYDFMTENEADKLKSSQITNQKLAKYTNDFSNLSNKNTSNEAPGSFI